MAIAPSLKKYLQSHNVRYDLVTHPRTVSAMRTAAAAHVPGDRLAKSVMLQDAQGYVMAVMPSTHRVDFSKLSKQLHRKLRLAAETDFGKLFKDCELGALPPVGAAYGIETIYDDSLAEQPEVYFEAGDHEALVHVSGDQFKALMAEAAHGDISEHV